MEQAEKRQCPGQSYHIERHICHARLEDKEWMKKYCEKCEYRKEAKVE